MIQITEIKLYVPAHTSAERLSFVYPNTPDIGFFDTVNPSLIRSRVNQKQRYISNKIMMVSAGYVLTVTTMRPDVFIDYHNRVEAGYAKEQKGSSSGMFVVN